MDRMKQCQAKSKRSGRRCKRYASKGMKVCRMHGGALGSKKAHKSRRQAAFRHGLHTQRALQEKTAAYQLIKLCQRTLRDVL